MISLLVTHPGSAHNDDFIATCLLVAKYGAPVVRRAPTPAELADPQVCVVDVGDEHCAERMNFDHHQFSREHTPTCSISLVLQHLGLYADARRFCEWLEPAEWIDTRGPNRAAEWMGVSRAVVDRLTSPVDMALLRRFGSRSELKPGDPLYEVMRFVGEEMLEFLATTRERIDFIAAHAEIWQLEKDGATFEAAFLPRTEPLPADPSADLERYVRTARLNARIVALVYPDRRSPGTGIARFEDHPKLDFSRVAGQPDVLFTHKTGFLCKTSSTEPERLKELILSAWG